MRTLGVEVVVLNELREGRNADPPTNPIRPNDAPDKVKLAKWIIVETQHKIGTDLVPDVLSFPSAATDLALTFLCSPLEVGDNALELSNLGTMPALGRLALGDELCDLLFERLEPGPVRCGCRGCDWDGACERSRRRGQRLGRRQSHRERRNLVSGGEEGVR